LATLIDVLDSDVTTPFADHPALAAACGRINDEVAPAARRLLGEAPGRAWLASCWRMVAQQAAALPFRADVSDLHAAPLWLRAGDWGEARRAVERIESWGGGGGGGGGVGGGGVGGGGVVLWWSWVQRK
jgi:hypothetical protein